MKLIYILTPIFGGLLGACGISIVDQPIKTIILLLFFAVSVVVANSTASNKS